MGRIGPTEIIIVAVLIIVIFGWKKLPTPRAASAGPPGCSSPRSTR